MAYNNCHRPTYRGNLSYALIVFLATLLLIYSELIVVLYERLVQGKPQRTLDGKNQVIPQIAPKPDATKEPVFSEER